jgi:hypothetical protein
LKGITLRRIGGVIAAAAVVAGLLVSIAVARRSDSPLIRVNASIGDISILASRATVEARYGAPESTLELVMPEGSGVMARYREHGALLLVTFDGLGRVAAIQTESTHYKTPDGVGPGSFAADLGRLSGFRTDFCTLGRWNGSAATGANDIVTVFSTSGDRVASVLITRAALHTACPSPTSSGELSPAVGDGGFTVTALADPADGGSIRSTPPGISCPIDCSEFVLPGTTLTFVAQPAVGFTFERWGGDCEFLDPCVIRADGPRHVVAHFRAPPPPPPPPPPEEGGGEEGSEPPPPEGEGGGGEGGTE